MFRRLRPFIAAFAIGIGALAGAQSGVGHPTSPSVAPHWSCRASATYATLAGNGQKAHVEPAAANGNATTGADSDQCQSDDAGFPNPTIQQGNDQGSLTAEEPFAQTRINNDFTYKQ